MLITINNQFYMNVSLFFCLSQQSAIPSQLRRVSYVKSWHSRIASSYLRPHFSTIGFGSAQQLFNNKSEGCISSPVTIEPAVLLNQYRIRRKIRISNDVAAIWYIGFDSGRKPGEQLSDTLLSSLLEPALISGGWQPCRHCSFSHSVNSFFC